MKMVLPLIEYFDQVKDKLLPFMGAVMLREEKHLKIKFANKDILFHTTGLIDEEFDGLVNNRRTLDKLNFLVALLSFDIWPSYYGIMCPERGYIAQGPILTESQILDHSAKKIANIRRHFKGRISVENLNYYDTGAYEVVCNPDFINKFVKKFNVGLTLDIGHAEVSCNNFSMDIYDYLEKMPLSNTVEIHIHKAERNWDSHFLPTEKEYKLLDFILERSSADYIILEYGDDPEGIIKGNRELMQFLKKRGLYEN